MYPDSLAKGKTVCVNTVPAFLFTSFQTKNGSLFKWLPHSGEKTDRTDLIVF